MNKLHLISVGGLIVFIVFGFCGLGYLAYWHLGELKRSVDEAKASRELCYVSGYSELRDGWCIKGASAPVLVDSLRGENEGQNTNSG